VARDANGIRWHRCLRCDSWLPLPKPEAPTREYPPDRDEIELPLRGKGLRDKVVLRLIAVDRALHFLILGTLGIVIVVFTAHETSLRSEFYRALTGIQSGLAGGPVQTSGHHVFLHELDKLFTVKPGTLRNVGWGLLAFALLEGVEAVGLWLTKRWAEYLTFLATTLLLPLEVKDIIDRQTALRIIGFLVNLAVVVYLLYAKRLFGLRGGGKVDEELRNQDMGWEVLERTAPEALHPGAGAAQPATA
jgi:uncharacterized membrane protein (DUF2068 family)